MQQLIDHQTLRSGLYLSTTASTNSTALELLERQGFGVRGLPKLVLADQQTAGRGRQGNHWQSESDALTFSVVAECADQNAFSLLSIAVGVAVARAFEFLVAPAKIALKWPNDIGCFSTDSDSVFRKIAGVLIETNASNPTFAVIGIGINLNVSPSLPRSLRQPATVHRPSCLAEVAGRTMDRATVLGCVIESLCETLAELHASPSRMVQHYRDRCFLDGAIVSMKQGDRTIEGRCAGVSDDGSLELIVNGVLTLIRSGDVQTIRRID